MNLRRLFTTVLELSKEPFEAPRKEWEGHTVVVRSLDRWVPANWVVPDVAILRKIEAEVEAVPFSDDHLARWFKLMADRDRAFIGGPWVVAGQLLAMEPWVLDFVPSLDAMKMTVVWIRLFRLSVEYWSSETILRIAAVVGRPLAVDGITEQQRMMGFARVKVAIDAIVLLLPGVQIRGR